MRLESGREQKQINTNSLSIYQVAHSGINYEITMRDANKNTKYMEATASSITQFNLI